MKEKIEITLQNTEDKLVKIIKGLKTIHLNEEKDKNGDCINEIDQNQVF